MFEVFIHNKITLSFDKFEIIFLLAALKYQIFGNFSIPSSAHVCDSM